MRVGIASLAVFAAVLAPAAQPTDTLRLGEVTVTSERVPLAAGRAAVEVVTAEEIERLPVRTLAEVLALTPGFAFLNGDGAGAPPAATVRGFYGGGEAEYVLVLFDGQTVNDVETGVVDWELVALGAVERVEVAAFEATHTAWSPRVGANLRWVSTARHLGHVYAQAGRLFMAPTLDQLFDQRTIEVPLPPNAVSLSNAGLLPQRGTSVEAGIRHAALVGPVTAEASVAVYRIDMEDEIDFSLQDSAYGDIGESVHRGVEVVASAGAAGGRVFGTYTDTGATIEGGAFDGRFLKAIPRDAWTLGASGRRGAVTASAVARGAGRIWLDDANTVPLDGWAALDARALDARGAVPLAGREAAMVAEAVNLTDAEYATTGFPGASGAEAPGGGPLVHLYPAAGRQLRLGLSLSR